MDLVLWRHAEAVQEDDPRKDSLRKLTLHGEKQASHMALWLDRQLPQNTKIWVSPATRTQQTAQALGRPFKTHAEIGPNASVDNLIETVKWPHNKDTVLLVGHQPTLGQLVARLLDVHCGELHVERGAVWWLRHRLHDGVGQTTLISVQSPDIL